MWGGIAQLVEHVLCKHEVTGSNPVASTNQIAECRLMIADGFDCDAWVAIKSEIGNRKSTIFGRVAQLVRARP